MPDIVLITGANAGLGLATVQALLSSEKEYHILLCARSAEKAGAAVESLKSQTSKSTVTPHVVDVTDDQSIEQLYREVERDHGRVDVLVNNAGSSFEQTQSTGSTLRQIFTNTFDVNITGAHVMTYTFAPLLLESSTPRLLFLTSGASSLTETLPENINPVMAKRPGAQAAPKGWPKEPAYTGAYAYRSAKTGLNMLMRHWERMLRNDGVKVWSVSPGFLATNLNGNVEMLRKLGAVDPSVGAEVVKGAIEGKRDGEVGMVVNKTGVQPW